MLDQEDETGCPRQWRARYVDKNVTEEKSYPLRFGTLIHEALYLMEEEALGPEEALDRVFPVDMKPEDYGEALRDLRAYVERGASPVDRFGTLASETELSMLLYEDDEYGPIYLRGIIDWLGIDLNEPSLLHAVDFKSNRQPPKVDDVRKSIQLKVYDLLIRANWPRFMPTHPMPRVVMHLDAIKWRDVEVRFTPAELEEVKHWLIAVARTILRDEEAKPRTNPGCAFCPVKADCPAFGELPVEAKALLEGKPKNGNLEALQDWRDAANRMRLLLEKSVKAVDDDLKAKAELAGGLLIGNQSWALESDWRTEVNVRRLHALLGEQFYDVASVSKKSIEELTRDWAASDADAVLKCFDRVVVGAKVTRKKAESA